MAISLTCVCGSRLEIDDKFKGRKIPCPDCNRLLDTTPPPPPPKQTSGWALASVIVSLVGMLTLVGPIAGIVCGVIGLRQTSRDPKIAGAPFARAGIVLGCLFTLISFLALTRAEFLNLDGFLRLVSQSRDLRFSSDLIVRSHKVGNGDYVIRLKRPSLSWGVRPLTETDVPDELTLISPWDDAQILVLRITELADNTAEDYRRDAISAFLKTGLVKLLTGSNEAPPFPLPDEINVLNESEKNSFPQTFLVDCTWNATPRVFLFRLSILEGNRYNVAIGGTRRSRFGRLEESIVKSLESCELERQN